MHDEERHAQTDLAKNFWYGSDHILRKPNCRLRGWSRKTDESAEVQIVINGVKVADGGRNQICVNPRAMAAKRDQSRGRQDEIANPLELDHEYRLHTKARPQAGEK